jgi:bifunctional non-homologous end joining protein LigD
MSPQGGRRVAVLLGTGIVYPPGLGLKPTGEEQDQEHDEEDAAEPDPRTAIGATAVPETATEGEDDENDQKDQQHAGRCSRAQNGGNPLSPEPFPEHLVPMFATASTEVPADDEAWAFELKWDGVRAVAYLRGDGTIHLESRNLNDVTARYPEVHGLADAWPGHALVLDGEVVAFDEEGKPSFGALQTRMHLANEREVAARSGSQPVAYLIFDVLHLDGQSTRHLPWLERRIVLDRLDLSGPSWQTPAAHLGGGADLLAASKAGGLEGVVAKRTSSPYLPGRRTKDWLKIKNTCRQEVVIGGWLPGAGNRTGRIGALLIGYYDDEDEAALRFAGKVGTGFTGAELDRLAALFEPLTRPTSPFADRVPFRESVFLEPSLVAEVEFTEWTHTGTLRHPSYKGLRDDKPASAVRREAC